MDSSSSTLLSTGFRCFKNRSYESESQASSPPEISPSLSRYPLRAALKRLLYPIPPPRLPSSVLRDLLLEQVEIRVSPIDLLRLTAIPGPAVGASSLEPPIGERWGPDRGWEHGSCGWVGASELWDPGEGSGNRIGIGDRRSDADTDIAPVVKEARRGQPRVKARPRRGEKGGPLGTQRDKRRPLGEAQRRRRR
ncbi:hypothetical protein J5N97_025073 [Dioscorea zingiberensis]|uniref:Uncharacterized protein n=1 Tax=Dioscorea zingiberensis TaxID=325984 RepID=A0A9D5C7L6_9LILI|nr:hypothetical protein J5N97_025073 [Dioscorea zingiberensis]